ncbi:unnamed protein product [Brassica rapa subsp. narinosa]
MKKMKKMKRNDEESRRRRENTFCAPEDMCLKLFLILVRESSLGFCFLLIYFTNNLLCYVTIFSSIKKSLPLSILTLSNLSEIECFYDRLSEGPLRHLACPALRATVLARRGSLCMVWSTFAPGVLLSSRYCHPPFGFIDADYGYFPYGVDGLYSGFL